MSLTPSPTGSRVDLPTPAPGAAGIERLREGGDERRGLIPLDRNERLSPLPDSIVEELRAGISSELSTEYPVLDGAYSDLERAVQLPRDQLLLTAGSDAAFKALHQCYVRPGDRVVMLDPTYAMYRVYSQMFQATAVSVPIAKDLSLDSDRLVGAIASDTRLVLLANPNQPTGTLLSQDALDAVIERTATARGLVIIDEAYFPFSRATVLASVANRPNLVVTRTFSKAWGLAGARLGFVAAHPEVVRTLFKVRSVYDIAAFSAHCLRVLLSHPEIADDYVAEVEAGRDLLVARARELDLEPVVSPTNFLLLRVGTRVKPDALVSALRKRGYLVKGPFTAPCLGDCIRVTLGPPRLMADFASALGRTLDSITP